MTKLNYVLTLLLGAGLWLDSPAQSVRNDADRARDVLDEARNFLKLGKYAEAQQAFMRFRDMPGTGLKSKQVAEKYLADCRFSLQATQHPVQFLPTNLGAAVNSSSAEYFPMLTADRQLLIYTRRANDHENFYQSGADSSGKWQTAVPLRGSVNSENYNEGAHCITPDGKYLFFTGCNRPGGMGSCDIYVARREGLHTWGEPYNLGAPVNTPGWEAQPALSADGRTLYFVSNRPGGQGGYDIWMARLLKNGCWGAAENLGKQINTPYDESTPYIHADGQTLYFASNGWPGLGDKDIFMSRADSSGGWQLPVNLGYPINDYQEQFALTVTMNGRQAFFSTNRKNGFGDLDIYTFELPDAVQPLSVAYLKGEIVDGDSGDKMQAQVTVTDVATNKTLYDETADYEDGSFLAPLPFGHTYALHVKQPGYLFYSANYTLASPDKANDAYNIQVKLLKIKAGQKSVLNNIFFATNKFTLLENSKADLEALSTFLKLNGTLKIEIGGHTDNTGTDKGNLILSEKRAKAVYDYLLTQGIKPPQMSYKGYGSLRPLASNDNEAGRNSNRRTDFCILSVGN
ncbi:Outer membrane protein OmpA [bacterium A37T11]|nr:Outer membrane protein OmpA [bacterium A37T11]